MKDNLVKLIGEEWKSMNFTLGVNKVAVTQDGDPWVGNSKGYIYGQFEDKWVYAPICA
jgi:hypothetical protein